MVNSHSAYGLPHFNNARAALYNDNEQQLKELRFIKLQKIKYRLKYKTNDGFEPKR